MPPLDFAIQCGAVQIRHTDIAEDQLIRPHCQLPQRLLAIAYRLHHMPIQLLLQTERMPREPGNVL